MPKFLIKVYKALTYNARLALQPPLLRSPPPTPSPLFLPSYLLFLFLKYPDPPNFQSLHIEFSLTKMLSTLLTSIYPSNLNLKCSFKGPSPTP